MLQVTLKQRDRVCLSAIKGRAGACGSLCTMPLTPASIYALARGGRMSSGGRVSAVLRFRTLRTVVHCLLT